MKRLFALLLSLSLLLCACGGGEAPAETTTQPTQATEATEATTEATGPGLEVTEEVKAKLDEILNQNKYKGLIQLTHKGEVVYQYVSGENDLGEPLTMDSPTFLGSASKQFCAAAILMLRDQGKLSLEDTLEKYFPEYTIGKDITLHNLLSMRSGIVRDMDSMWTEPEKYENNTPEENDAIFKEYIFNQPLGFEPGAQFMYCNVNYVLLSFIVEQITGMEYEDFIRQNIFEPLGMSHSGFKRDIRDGTGNLPGLTLDNVVAGKVSTISQGAGGIASTAADMDIWMTALRSGQVIAMESFREMTTNHSPELPVPPEYTIGYGYGLEIGTRGGWKHGGNNGGYATMMYFNEEYGFHFFMASGQTPRYDPGINTRVSNAFLNALFAAVA